MPRGDGTGPMGSGPMTGRRFGGGGGFGGRGRGWRHCFKATGLPGWARAGRGTPSAALAPQMTQEQEVAALKGQAQCFEKALEDIKKRIEGLAAGKKPE